MDGRCTECGCNNVALHHYLDHLCYECYEKLFKEINVEEPDFELKSEVADIKSAIDSGTLIHTGVNYHTIKMPKRMVFDPDCRVKDYDKLILFLLENMHIYENAKGFDKVKYMFKEVE